MGALVTGEFRQALEDLANALAAWESAEPSESFAAAQMMARAADRVLDIALVKAGIYERVPDSGARG